jgi:hypothetical protein
MVMSLDRRRKLRLNPLVFLIFEVAPCRALETVRTERIFRLKGRREGEDRTHAKSHTPDSTYTYKTVYCYYSPKPSTAGIEECEAAK